MEYRVYEYFSSPRSSEFIQWLLCGSKSDSFLSLSPNNTGKNQPHSWEERVNFWPQLQQNEKDTQLKPNKQTLPQVKSRLLKLRTFIGIKEKQYTKKNYLRNSLTLGYETLNFFKTPFPLYGYYTLTYLFLIDHHFWLSGYSLIILKLCFWKMDIILDND